MKVETQVNSGDIYILYMYTTYYKIYIYINIHTYTYIYIYLFLPQIYIYIYITIHIIYILTISPFTISPSRPGAGNGCRGFHTSAHLQELAGPPQEMGRRRKPKPRANSEKRHLGCLTLGRWLGEGRFLHKKMENTKKIAVLCCFMFFFLIFWLVVSGDDLLRVWEKSGRGVLRRVDIEEIHHLRWVPGRHRKTKRSDIPGLRPSETGVNFQVCQVCFFWLPSLKLTVRP